MSACAMEGQYLRVAPFLTLHRSHALDTLFRFAAASFSLGPFLFLLLAFPSMSILQKLPIHAYTWRQVGTTLEKGRRLV